MRTEKYNPIDTSNILLPDNILLGEQIAKNVNEVWAEARIKEGWTYGKNVTT